MAKSCSECGSVLVGSRRFCSDCGAAVGAVEALGTGAVVEPKVSVPPGVSRSGGWEPAGTVEVRPGDGLVVADPFVRDAEAVQGGLRDGRWLWQVRLVLESDTDHPGAVFAVDEHARRVSRVRLVHADHVSDPAWLWGDRPLLPMGVSGELTHESFVVVDSGQVAWRLGPEAATVDVDDLERVDDASMGWLVALMAAGRVLVTGAGFGDGTYPFGVRSVDGQVVEVQVDFGLEPADWVAAALGVNDPDRLFSLGRAALDVYDTDAARVLFTRAADDGHPVAMTGLGNLANAEGDHVGAREWWRRAGDAGRLQALVNLGLLANSLGESGEATALWTEAVDRWTGDVDNRAAAVEAMVCLGVQAHEHQDRAGERTWLDRAADTEACDPRGFVFGVSGMSEVSWRVGQSAEGMLAGIAADEACPGGPWQPLPVDLNCSMALWVLDRAAAESARLEVNDFATRLLAQFPDQDSDNPAVSGPIVVHGPTVLTRPPAGEGLPGLPGPLMEFLDGFTDDYIANRGARALPEDPTDGFGEPGDDVEIGDGDEEYVEDERSEEELRRDAEAGDYFAMGNLGFRLAESGDNAEAELWDRRAIEAAATAEHEDVAATVANNLAFSVLIPAGRHDEARQVLRAAIALDVGYQSYNALSNLGVLEYAAGNHIQAKALFKQVVDSGDGPIDEAHYYLGLIAEAAGKMDKARQQWRKAADGVDEEYARKASDALARTTTKPGSQRPAESP